MSKTDSGNAGCGCLIGIILIILFFVNQCNDESKNNSSSKKPMLEKTVDEVAEEYTDKAPLSKEPQLSDEDLKFLDNRLSNGVHPYENEIVLKGQGSRISVETSASDNDVVVILKRNDKMVRNSYLRAGESIFFDIPDGTYQIFFYSGKGWNPTKVMANGLEGGFVVNESFSKDEPHALENQDLEYELILQSNGNFMTEQSNATEIFN